MKLHKLDPYVKMLVRMLSCSITLLMMNFGYLYLCCFFIIWFHILSSFFFSFGVKVYVKQLKETSWMLIVCSCSTLTWLVYSIALSIQFEVEEAYLVLVLQPNLSASWLFQRAMSVRPHVNVSPTFINELLFANFQSMQVT